LPRSRAKKKLEVGKKQGFIDTLSSFLIISPTMKRLNALTDVPGIKVGHASDLKALTGCTVILCEEGAIGAVDIRGTAAGQGRSMPSPTFIWWIKFMPFFWLVEVLSVWMPQEE
jgi:hypothetical protein